LILGDEMNQTRQAMMPREGLQQDNANIILLFILLIVLLYQ